jgi:non-ribosomal peptide synthetase component E (peptide arylation enzyme)
VVALEPGAGTLTVRQVDEYLTAAGLMRQKIPERVELVDRLPRNAAGKVPKSDLIRRFSE